MAAQIFENNHEINKQDIQASIAKAVELRAIHSALLQGNSPANLRFQSSASPSIQRSTNQLSAHDYPVFTPSYEDEQLPDYRQMQPENRRLSQIWSEIGLETGVEDDETRGLSLGLVGRDHNIYTSEDHRQNRASCTKNQITILQTSPNTEILKSGRRNGFAEFMSVTNYNTCKSEDYNIKNSSTTLPNLSPHKRLKNRGQILSWLFPRSKKKPKAEVSPNKLESEDASQFLKEWGIFSIESLKKQLLEANEDRDAALKEASQMKFSMEELKQKLIHLEKYCDDLKKALNQAMQGRDTQSVEKPILSRRTKSVDGGRDSLLPVSHEAMVEGFLQIVSEARLSVKHFSKTLVAEIDETDDNLMESLISILQPHNLTLQYKNSRGFLYCFESLMNQSFHQDFENCSFQKNGPQKVLDPYQDRQSKFSEFVSLRNLSWNEVLKKGTKYYSEEFSRFCDQKMNCIVLTLNWTKQWPEHLLQSFFVAAKCIWLLHLLAFSFDPPISILRVDENQSFDSQYMEDVMLERPGSQTASKVKMMVIPGFYIVDRVLKCKVLCRHRMVA